MLKIELKYASAFGSSYGVSMVLLSIAVAKSVMYDVEMELKIPLTIARATAVGNHSRIPRRKIELAATVLLFAWRKGMHIVRAERRMMAEYISFSFQNKTDSVFRRISRYTGP